MKKQNLLLISLDTLRADTAYKLDLPCIKTLYGQGVRFMNTISSSPLTPVSHASVFTSLQPNNHGIRHLFKEKLSTPSTTLAEIFQRAGYKTGAIVSCPGLNKWYGMDAGFEQYDDEIPQLADGTNPLHTIDVKKRGASLKRAPLVVERGINWLKEYGQSPFMLFLHFFDTHWPYEPPEWFAPEGSNPYEGEAFYMDYYLGKFFDEANRLGFLKDTLIIIFSDHGEDLGGWYSNDHAGIELGHPEEEGHGCLLFDATQKVPLIFIHKELIPANKDIDTQVRLIDIFPTIIDLLDLPDNCDRDGISLRNLFYNCENHRIAYSETYYREEQSNSENGVPGLGPWKSLRIDNKYKVVLDVNSSLLTLYNLFEDINEKKPIKFGELNYENEDQ